MMFKLYEIQKVESCNCKIFHGLIHGSDIGFMMAGNSTKACKPATAANSVGGNRCRPSLARDLGRSPSPILERLGFNLDLDSSGET